MLAGKDRRAADRIQKLQLDLDTATVDRDYFRGQRDRLQENVELLDGELRAWADEIAQLRQALRQIIVAVESDSDERLAAVLRIARVTLDEDITTLVS